MSKEILVTAQGGNGDKDYDNANDEKSSDTQVFLDIEEENQMDSGDGA